MTTTCEIEETFIIVEITIYEMHVETQPVLNKKAHQLVRQCETLWQSSQSPSQKKLF